MYEQGSSRKSPYHGTSRGLVQLYVPWHKRMADYSSGITFIRFEVAFLLRHPLENNKRGLEQLVSVDCHYHTVPVAAIHNRIPSEAPVDARSN